MLEYYFVRNDQKESKWFTVLLYLLELLFVLGIIFPQQQHKIQGPEPVKESHSGVKLHLICQVSLMQVWSNKNSHMLSKLSFKALYSSIRQHLATAGVDVCPDLSGRMRMKTWLTLMYINQSSASSKSSLGTSATLKQKQWLSFSSSISSN